MGAKITIFSVLIMLYIGAFMAPQEASAQGGYVSMQVFYDELSPYGTWALSNDYGYVWIPDAGPGFSPYASEGYWLFTDQGWTWISYYSWGWAPFHYGRWHFDPYYGYMWIPDYEWGPGWVTWRKSGDYYGWAPIGPGVNITFAYSSEYYIPGNQWIFVRDRDFGRRNINNYYVNSSTNVTIINNSTVINNIQVDRTSNVKYNAGPDRAEVEKHVGKTITPVAMKERQTPGQSLHENQLHIYKPRVNKNISTGGKNPAPSNLKNFENLKPAVQKTGGTSREKVKQPAKQQSSQPQQMDQPVKQQPAKQQVDQPGKQQQTIKQANQKPSDPQKTVQPKKADKGKQPAQNKPAKNENAEKPPR